MATLTPTELAQLKAIVVADPTANGYLLAQDTFSLAQWLNAQSGTDVAWKSSLSGNEIAKSLITGSAEIDNLTQGKRDMLLWLADRGQYVDARVAQTRQAFVDLTSASPTNATATRAALQANAQRALRRWEKVFVSPATPQAGAYVTTYEGDINGFDPTAINRMILI